MFVVYFTFALAFNCALTQEVVNLQKDFMVCRPLANVFGTVERTVNNKTESIPVIQGAVGPRGPPGEAGAKGASGEPDYSKVSEIVDSKIQLINGRLYQMEKILQKMKAERTISDVESNADEAATYGIDCLNKFGAPLNDGNQCFKIIGDKGITYKKTAAEKACNTMGGHLGDLSTREMYNKMYEYIDHTYSVVIDAWTGMTFENDKLLTFNGSMAGHAKWSTGYPRDSTRSYYNTYTAVVVTMDTSSNIKKLTNVPPTHTKNFAICQFSLNPDDVSTTTRVLTTASTTTRYYNRYNRYSNDDHDDYDKK